MTNTEILTAAAWRGTAILLAAPICAAMLKRASASVRHLVWTAAFGALLLLPAAEMIFPQVAPRVAASEAMVVTVPHRSTAPSPTPRRPDRVPVLPLVWAAGCAAAAAWFAAGAARTSWMARRAHVSQTSATAAAIARDLGIRRNVRVLESANVPMPLTWGIARPLVLLPAEASRWPEPRLRVVLQHELVHVRRFDVLSHAIAQAACCLFWFHPLAWIGLRQLRLERERACDDAVLRLGIAAHAYAGHLMELVRAMAARRNPIEHAPAMADASDLERRVRAMLDGALDRRPVSWRSAIPVAATALLLVLAVTVVRVEAQVARSGLTGTVLDPSGARIPECWITAKSLDGPNQESATCDPAGQYRFVNIPAGRYELQFSARGFTLQRVPVTLAPNIPGRVDANLEVGAITETVAIRGQKSATAVPAQTAERVRVGGSVTMARLIRQPKPDYPSYLQGLGIEGSVVIRAIISKTGEVLSARVVNTVDERLAKIALDAVQQWHYDPARLNGEPVETITTITLEFRLDQ